MVAPIVRMDRVSKRFGSGTLALRDMTVAVSPGEFVALLGPSGCGKSTALRLIAGLIAPSAGAIEIAPGAGGREHDLGFVFQEPTLMPWASVFDNVFLPLRLAGMGRAEAEPRVRTALREVGLSAFTEAWPRELSGGMKMRVSIARALVTRPRILLMDEPFAALDEMTRAKLNNDVLRLWAEHELTVVFVTHSVFESVYLATRVLVMAARPGRVAADIPVTAPWPRDDAFRSDPAYVEQARGISETLKGTLDVAHVDH